MKKSTSIFLTVVSLPAILSAGCSPSVDGAPVVKTVKECAKATGNPETWCKLEMDKAQKIAAKDAPKFDSKAKCEEEFGSCQQTPTSTGAGGAHGSFVPFVAGYAISSLLNSNNGYSQPVYSHRSGGLVSSSGYKTVVARGGFGSSARGSYGG